MSTLRRARAVLFRQALRLLADGSSSNGVPGKNRRFSRSFKNALRGILFTFINERNFRFEALMAVLAVIAGLAFGIDRLEWAIILTNVFLVLALEAKNTSLELTTNIATREYDYGAKGSKDASSGAVLLASASSVLAGLFIFAPRIFALVWKTVSILLGN